MQVETCLGPAQTYQRKSPGGRQREPSFTRRVCLPQRPRRGWRRRSRCSAQAEAPEQQRVGFGSSDRPRGLRAELKRRPGLSFFSVAEENPGEAGRSRERRHQRERSEFSISFCSFSFECGETEAATAAGHPAGSFPEFQDMLKAVLAETGGSETTKLSQFSVFLQLVFADCLL